MIRRRLSHVAPEELLLIPIVILVVVAILVQPSAITRLFESPYATPAPGEAPAERFLREGAPSPTPASAPRERIELGGIPLQRVPTTVFSTGVCPGTTAMREWMSTSGEHVIVCVDTDGTVHGAGPVRRPLASPGSPPRARILTAPSSASGR